MKTKTKLAMSVAIISLCAGTWGCESQLSAITSPPPTKSAEIDNSDEKITISKGVALGFECTHQGSPCDGMTLSTDNPVVAEVREASVDELDDEYAYQSAQPRSVYVIIGKEPGITTLKLEGDDPGNEYEVTVTSD